MFRFEDGKDIEQDEFETIIAPFLDVCHDYLRKEVAPQYAAFYLANGFKMSALWSASYYAHLNSALDVISFPFKEIDNIKTEVTTILLDKYKLKVICDDPLDFEEVD